MTPKSKTLTFVLCSWVKPGVQVIAPNPKIASPGSNPKIRFSIKLSFTKLWFDGHTGSLDDLLLV